MLAYAGKVLLQDFHGNQAEVVVVRTGPNSWQDFVCLGRRENESHVLGWFLNKFEQCVKTCWRNHVVFVDDINLVTRFCWTKHGSLTQIAGVIDRAVACRIEFDNVN